MKQPLTNKQREILMCIAKKINTHGYQPSYREIAKRFGFSSPNAVTGHLAAAERKGACKRIASRAIQFDWRKYL